MALEFSAQPAPPLQLTATCTIYSGIVRLVMTGRFFQSARAAADEFGGFLPDVPPLPAGAPEPRVWAEGWWMSTASAPASGFPAGVEYVRATYLPDPRAGGTARWLYLGGAAHIGKEITIGYRVTVQAV